MNFYGFLSLKESCIHLSPCKRYNYLKVGKAFVSKAWTHTPFHLNLSLWTYIYLLVILSFQCLPCVVLAKLGLSLLHRTSLCPLDKYVSLSLTYSHGRAHTGKIVPYSSSNKFAFAAWIAGLMQTLLYADFFYYYILR